MVNIQDENLLLCIPEFDGDCGIPSEDEIIVPDDKGFDNGDMAVLLHGLVAVANVVVPITLRFLVVQYQLLPSLSQYATDYFGICGILYWITWQAFWSVHGTLFAVPAVLWLFTYFGVHALDKVFVSFLNMTYFATFILYPILLGAFGVSASPYLFKSASERATANFGEHGEKYSFFVYLSLTFTTAWIQFAFNKDLNRYLNGDPYLCDPFGEDCSAVYQAARAAEQASNNEEVSQASEAAEDSDSQFAAWTF